MFTLTGNAAFNKYIVDVTQLRELPVIYVMIGTTNDIIKSSKLVTKHFKNAIFSKGLESIM